MRKLLLSHVLGCYTGLMITITGICCYFSNLLAWFGGNTRLFITVTFFLYSLSIALLLSKRSISPDLLDYILIAAGLLFNGMFLMAILLFGIQTHDLFKFENTVDAQFADYYGYVMWQICLWFAAFAAGLSLIVNIVIFRAFKKRRTNLQSDESL